MRYLLLIVAIALGLTAFSQTPRPTTLPSPNSTGYAKWGYVRGDSAFLLGLRGDTTWVPITSALSAVKFAGRDTSILYFYDGVKWKPAGAGAGGGGSTVDSFFYQLRQLNDTTVLFDRGDGVVDTLAISGSGGGGGSGLNKVDSVTTVGDSLFYWINGDEYFVANLAAAAAGGDTTIFVPIIDTTGNDNYRVLYAKDNKITASGYMKWSEVFNRLTISPTSIITSNYDSIRLVVDGAIYTGRLVSISGRFENNGGSGMTASNDSLKFTPTPSATDTSTYKPAALSSAGGLVRMSRWPQTGSTFPTIGNGLKLDGGVLRWADTLQETLFMELNGRILSFVESGSGNFIYVGDDYAQIGAGAGVISTYDPYRKMVSTSADSILHVADSIKLKSKISPDSKYLPTTNSTSKYKVVLMDSTTGALVTTNPSNIGSDTSGTGSLYIRNQFATQEAKAFNIRSGRLDSLYAGGSGGVHFATNTGASAFEYGSGGGTQVTFNGFAGYNANRAASYTARSFTDKNYVDSSIAAGGGGMTNPMTTTGDLIYSSDNSGTPARVGIGSSGQILTVSGGLPTWQNASSSGVTTLAAIGSTPNANGATISGSTLNLQPANESFGGVLTTGTQNIEGSKYFRAQLFINAGATNYGSLRGGGSYFEVESATGRELHLNRSNTSQVVIRGSNSFTSTGNTLAATAFNGSVGISSGSTLSVDNAGQSGGRFQVRTTGQTHVNDLGAAAPTMAAGTLFQLESTTRGFLPPRMTTTQMNAISSPVAGLMIYNTTENATMTYDGTRWVGFRYNGTVYQGYNSTANAWTDLN